MSDQPWNRLPRTGSVMEVDSSQPRPPVTYALAPLTLVVQAPLNADAMPRKRRRLDSPESEETVGDQRDFGHHSTQDPRWQGPSHPPSDTSGYDSPTEADLHRLAITGPIASGEYYEKWPDTEADGDEPGFTQPAPDPPSPALTEVPLRGDGQSGALASRVFKGKPLAKEDTLMSIDFSHSQDDSTPRSDDALAEKLATMFDQMRQKQRDDMEMFAENIRAQLVVECADLKNEMTRLRAELVDLRIQYQRMQNGR
ncbi:hypothetical protein GSI_03002 [Ganoderma sinense ZZ0214-1]|uniref:Uncharacterized protein n=1 Tax=Ganoderma sinense ZZ0214-1 TaxID=1077348 RepID=A0A2G8SN70_9APHY|nr:hypothetical protein GSI_03002 [Ganoderma sinense ZZ0214-1]